MCQFIMDLLSRVARDRGVEAQILERLSLLTSFKIGLWHRVAIAPSDLQHNDLLKVVSSRNDELYRVTPASILARSHFCRTSYKEP